MNRIKTFVFQSLDKKSFVGIYDVKGLDNNPVIISLCTRQNYKEIEINIISKWGMFSETRLLYEDDTKKSNRIVFYAPIAGQIQFCRLQFKCMLQICFCQGFRREI